MAVLVTLKNEHKFLVLLFPEFAPNLFISCFRNWYIILKYV